MITLLTGQPGHGKTTRGLVLAHKLKEQGRVVYAHGVRGLDYDKIGFQRLEDPTKWEDLPDGSVVLIDECYSTFPTRAPGRQVPPHVDAMARHRHRGFDFILICQQGLQLDNFLRGLVEAHIHCKRKWGTRATKLKRWAQYQANTNATCSDVDDWVRPKWIYAYFESTTLDTSKTHVPKWIKLIGLLLAFVIGVTWFLKHRFETKVEEMRATAGAASDTRGTSGAGAARAGSLSFATPQDYVAAMTPRIESIPASAPIYDGRQVQQYPRAYCIATGGGLNARGEVEEPGCNCYTQQMTRVKMHPEACQSIANGGGEFDPFLDPPRDVAPPRDLGGGGGSPPPVDGASAPALAVVGVGSPGEDPKPNGTFRSQ